MTRVRAELAQDERGGYGALLNRRRQTQHLIELLFDDPGVDGTADQRRQRGPLGSLAWYVKVAITSMSVVLGLASAPQLAIVRNSKHYPDLWKVFTAATRALGIGTLIALAGLILDRDSSPVRFILETCVGAAILCVLRLARCLWVLEQIIFLLTRSRQSDQGQK